MSEQRKLYPDAINACWQHYVLAPGEMLFIPRWWWHFIMAIDRDTALRWRQQHLEENPVLRDESSSRTSSEPGCFSEHSVYYSANTGRKIPRIVHGNEVTRLGYDETDTLGEDAWSANCHDKVPWMPPDFSFSVNFWWGRRIIKE